MADHVGGAHHQPELIYDKPTQFVEDVENRLGWMPTEPRWKAVALVAGRVNRKIAENPELYTWRNLALAVELLAREHRVVRSPMGVFYHVPRALARANNEVTSDVAVRIHEAITEAFLAGEPDWVERLSRASGDARHTVLEEWRTHAGA